MKKHWTQTKAGRKRASEIAKAYHAKEKANHASFNHSAFLLGRITAEIEYYAASQGIPSAPLAAELTSLLQHQAGR
jgi:hypothetical protein